MMNNDVRMDAMMEAKGNKKFFGPTARGFAAGVGATLAVEGIVVGVKKIVTTVKLANAMKSTTAEEIIIEEAKERNK